MRKQYKCKKIAEKIKIDGDLNKASWRNIESIILFKTDTGEVAKQKTEVKALWNEEFLYICFQCEDDFICANKTQYNDKLYEEDVVEVFIDDNNDLKTYTEIEINPLNAVLHYFINNNLNDRIFCFARVDKSIISATIYDEKSKKWSTEIAIPMKEFVSAKNNPPFLGDKWGINFYRIDKGKTGYDEYSAWSYTGKEYFHIPNRFGEIIFTK